MPTRRVPAGPGRNRSAAPRDPRSPAGRPRGRRSIACAVSLQTWPCAYGSAGLGPSCGPSWLRRLAQMSWLGRLFGSKPPPPPPANSVIVSADVAVQLTAGGSALDVAVDSALRAFLEAQAKAAAAGEPERIPFWLMRDVERSGDLEDELRDRMAQRHAAEEEGEQAKSSPRQPSGEQMEIGGG